jgi:hypothetical protein
MEREYEKYQIDNGDYPFPFARLELYAERQAQVDGHRGDKTRKEEHPNGIETVEAAEASKQPEAQDDRAPDQIIYVPHCHLLQLLRPDSDSAPDAAIIIPVTLNTDTAGNELSERSCQTEFPAGALTALQGRKRARRGVCDPATGASTALKRIKRA